MEEVKVEKASLTYRLAASPGDSGFATIYTVDPGRILKIHKVIIHFPSGTAGELRLALYYGNLKVYPKTPYVNGDDVKLEDYVDLTWFSGDDVKLWYENTNVTTARYADVKLEGVLQ